MPLRRVAEPQGGGMSVVQPVSAARSGSLRSPTIKSAHVYPASEWHDSPRPYVHDCADRGTKSGATTSPTPREDKQPGEVIHMPKSPRCK
jgi:hypothetical protein